MVYEMITGHTDKDNHGYLCQTVVIFLFHHDQVGWYNTSKI